MKRNRLYRGFVSRSSFAGCKNIWIISLRVPLRPRALPLPCSRRTVNGSLCRNRQRLVGRTHHQQLGMGKHSRW